MRKKYVLDTNILLHSPNVIFGFDDNDVIITDITVAELDKHKRDVGEIGYNARKVARAIKEIGQKYKNLSYNTGIPINNDSGLFRIINGRPVTLEHYDNNIADNLILGATMELKRNSEDQVILVTNDGIMYIKAMMLGLEVQEYRNEQIENDNDYTGRDELYVSDEIIAMLYKDSICPIDAIRRDIEKEGVLRPEQSKEEIEFVENEFFTLKSLITSSSCLCMYRNGFMNVIKDEELNAYGITPRNSGQRFALKALLASPEEIPLVILKGNAGTAKTFLSLAAGLQKFFEGSDDSFNEILYTRNNVLFDNDIGALPGSEEDKMGPLVRGLSDNLRTILKIHTPSDMEIGYQIENMFADGIINVESMAFMRGRSITNTYIIIDEAQNATVSQIHGIITRVGPGSKIIICGDPNQTDNVKLDRKNNGLVFASERMKGCPMCAQLTFKESESVRSPLALEAAIRLA